LAYVGSCRALGIPAALERSRSGDGGHAWVFFSEPVPAALARKLGSLALTMTMEQHPGLGLRSYDRFFPNQDTLPKGGFGNLIALPLQKAARDHGNSVFVDDELRPFDDQWAYLSSLGRLDPSRVQKLVSDADAHGGVLGVRRVAADDEEAATPWGLSPSREPRQLILHGPMPDRLELVLSDQIYISKTGLPPPLRNRLLRLAAFQNPEFLKAQAMRLPTHGKPRVISCAEDYPEHLALPRGCLEEIRRLFKDLKIKPAIRDERFSGEPLDLTFAGQLKPEQETAAEKLLAHDIGVLAATTAFGKTVIASWLIARRGVNSLVLVHRQQLRDQWIERLSQFLGLDAKQLGKIGGGTRKPLGNVDVALIQSMVRKGQVDDLVGNYGHLIVDECHHIPAGSFELVARRCKARYVLGLTATASRKDGHHPIIFMQCGPVRHQVDARSQAAIRDFRHHVIVRPTGFRPPGEPETDVRLEFQRLCRGMSISAGRNALLVSDILAALSEGRSPLVLTERKEHLDLLAAEFEGRVPRLIILRGGMAKAAQTLAHGGLADSGDGLATLILATGRFVGEGFDHARLDTLFLAMPVSWKGTVAQYAGRLHRAHEGKREVRIYDYADLDVPMLASMFDRRCRAYESLGYTVLLPASALPGWPIEVPLPVDPRWKQNHTASVQRLIRDGVDIPLAGLFLEASRTSSSGDRDGQGEARSASEAFFHRRLESHPQLAGFFQMNTRLEIPFGDRCFMEVDFLAPRLRLAIELDGDQHLGDAAAWRRDRHKDRLLQEHGWMVLRFLASDLTKDLDGILDLLIRLKARREQSATPPMR
jgi:superfamily II DNA or RNA helicase/very-short-patch-repair endonuclease